MNWWGCSFFVHLVLTTKDTLKRPKPTSDIIMDCPAFTEEWIGIVYEWPTLRYVYSNTKQIKTDAIRILLIGFTELQDSHQKMRLSLLELIAAIEMASLTVSLVLLKGKIRRIFMLSECLGSSVKKRPGFVKVWASLSRINRYSTAKVLRRPW